MAFMSTMMIIMTMIIIIMTIMIIIIIMTIMMMTIITIMISVVGSFPKAAHWGWKLAGRTLLTTNGDMIMLMI